MDLEGRGGSGGEATIWHFFEALNPSLLLEGTHIPLLTSGRLLAPAPPSMQTSRHVEDLGSQEATVETLAPCAQVIFAGTILHTPA
jgi:hypothetical protein